MQKKSTNRGPLVVVLKKGVSLPVKQHISLASGEVVCGHGQHGGVVERVPAGGRARHARVVSAARRARVTDHRAQGVPRYT